MAQYIYYQGKQYPVPIQYSLPKGINAAEAGVLIDGSADPDDVLSLIYEWERKRIIKFEDTGSTIKFHKLKELPSTAKPYEQTLFNELFSDQKININKIRLEVLDYCFKMGWIEDPFGFHIDNPKKFFVVGLLLFLSFDTILQVFFGEIEVIFYLPFAIVLIILAIKIWSKPAYYSNSTLLKTSDIISDGKVRSFTKLTEKGKLLQSHLLGYKQYLKKIKITTKTDIIDDGTLSHRMSLNVNNGGNIINCIKVYKTNTYEDSYDKLFYDKLFEKIRNERLSNYYVTHKK